MLSILILYIELFVALGYEFLLSLFFHSVFLLLEFIWILLSEDFSVISKSSIFNPIIISILDLIYSRTIKELLVSIKLFFSSSIFYWFKFFNSSSERIFIARYKSMMDSFNKSRCSLSENFLFFTRLFFS